MSSEQTDAQDRPAIRVVLEPVIGPRYSLGRIGEDEPGQDLPILLSDNEEHIIIARAPNDPLVIERLRVFISRANTRTAPGPASGALPCSQHLPFDPELATALSRCVHDRCKNSIPHDIGITLAQLVWLQDKVKHI